MLTFVHPTKTGGTTVEQYFRSFYPQYIRGVGHIHTCSNSQRPIVIVREPRERFLSMYQYWKNGSIEGKYMRGKHWNPPITNIKEFIKKLKENDRAFIKQHLYKDFTTNLHFVEQTHWLKPKDHSDTIVIVYDKHKMDSKMENLLMFLNLPVKGLPLPKVNVTKVSDPHEISLSEEDEEWIKTRFKTDFDLWHLVRKHPNRFKKVF